MELPSKWCQPGLISPLVMDTAIIPIDVFRVTSFLAEFAQLITNKLRRGPDFLNQSLLFLFRVRYFYNSINANNF